MKERKSTKYPKDNNNNSHEDKENEYDGKGGFYACYLLTSLCPRFKGHTYIGFTVNPKRRIRQHNGEIRSGAFRTKKRRPWEMVFCIYGFPTNVAALQFEWAWQHPMESLAVRQAAATFKSFSGVANKIRLAYTMLNLPSWKCLDITVNYFSTKYTIHSSSCPTLPENMKVRVCPMDDLPCYSGICCGTSSVGSDVEDSGDEDESEKTSNTSVSSGASLVHLENCSMNELQLHGGRLLSLPDVGDDANGKVVDDQYRESSNTLETVKETLAEHKDNTTVDYSFYVSRKSRLLNENDRMQQMELNSQTVNQSSPSGFVDAPKGTTSSVVSIMPISENISGDDDLTSKFSICIGQSPSRSFTLPRETEVIDLLTPTPKFRASPSMKRRRVAPIVCTEIIDLT